MIVLAGYIKTKSPVETGEIINPKPLNRANIIHFLFKQHFA